MKNNIPVRALAMYLYRTDISYGDGDLYYWISCLTPPHPRNDEAKGKFKFEIRWNLATVLRRLFGFPDSIFMIYESLN